MKPAHLIRNALTVYLCWHVWYEAGPFTAVCIALSALQSEFVAEVLRTHGIAIKNLLGWERKA
jgi:hypothetical protein